MLKLLPIAACAGTLLLGAAGAMAAQDPFFASPSTVANFATYGTNTRPLGIAAGDFDKDGKIDLIVGRVSGNIHFVKGNGDGTFLAPAQLTWKQAFFNAWAFAAADVNGDGNLDVVWGANASSPGTAPFMVNDGDIRVFYGNGNGTFVENTYLVSGVLHNAGAFIADIGTDAGSLAVGDVDDDGHVDIVVGAVDAANTFVKLLRNGGDGTFAVETIVSQQLSCTAPCSPIYYPATSTQNSPWGLAFGDADGDGDLDLWVGDRAMYVYLYLNDGSGNFTLKGGNSAVANRPNVYLGHDAFRAAVGYTGSLASADLNGDGKADLLIGLQAGAQTTAVAHDGEILLDVSDAGGHVGAGVLADVGMVARGVTLIDVNGDGALDIVAGEYGGTVQLLRQLPPLDADGDGVSDYLDNALAMPNAPRLDMNTDATLNHRDQLDNDFDTVLGDPEDESTWQRLGDAVDPDDDNDGILDAADNCPFVANSGQGDVDSDGIGDACDPLDGYDSDGDGIVDGPLPGDPGFAFARDAAIKWASGTTRFVLRIDALGRFFQNEFTQLMTDAATLSPEWWAAKCWDNYDPNDFDPPYEPCGDDATKTLTLAGGKSVPITLVTIPKQLWTDPPVVAWINDRNANPLFEIGQHGSYHVDNTPLGDWKDMSDRNFYACETCGLSFAENFQLMRVGYDTLLGNYGNKWIAESGATAASPKIDWSDSSHGLISFSPPYNTSDTVARKAIAQLGYKGFSASVYEEGEAGSYGLIFTPEGSHHERFDQFGMFHVSADLQILPPATSNGSYDAGAYAAYLASKVDIGGLTTWLIEEVDWSGRPCNDADRLGDCNGGSNRENNTVYQPRWDAWIQLLDFVKTYPGGVAMTMGEVAMAKAYDNAPTVANPDQADADGNGIGDVIDGATLTTPATAILSRNADGNLQATLANGAGQAISGQQVAFSFDRDDDGTNEVYTGMTDGSGVARVAVMPTRPVGTASYAVAWDGIRVTATATGNVAIADSTQLALDATNPTSGQVTDQVTVGATLRDSSDVPLGGRVLRFAIGTASATGTTDAAGHATATLTLAGPAAAGTVVVAFDGVGAYGPSTRSAAFTVLREFTLLTLTDAIAEKSLAATATATLTEDTKPLAGRSIEFQVQEKVRGQLLWTSLGTAVTNGSGVATSTIPTKYVSKTPRPIRAVSAADTSFEGSSADASAYRN